jgi:type I restriction enzyme R subunit
VHLYNEIIALRPDWHDPDPEKGKIKIVMTGSASDKPLLQPHIYNKQVKKRLEKRFKDVKDPLQLVIAICGSQVLMRLVRTPCISISQ